MSDCNKRQDHDHQHGPGCGHVPVEHEGHTDYLHDGHLHQGERLKRLNQIAVRQMQILTSAGLKALPRGEEEKK